VNQPCGERVLLLPSHPTGSVLTGSCRDAVLEHLSHAPVCSYHPQETPSRPSPPALPHSQSAEQGRAPDNTSETQILQQPAKLLVFSLFMHLADGTNSWSGGGKRSEGLQLCTHRRKHLGAPINTGINAPSGASEKSVSLKTHKKGCHDPIPSVPLGLALPGTARQQRRG